jgi:NhaA family Na+:H+ antiporter
MDPMPRGTQEPSLQGLPISPVQHLSRPFVRFLELEAASGVVLLACTFVALVWSNSPWAASYQAFWHTPVGLTIGTWRLEHSLAHWINDGLMTIFFFVVGLEIKRELVMGELREPRKAALPAVAALGGMIVPAAIYLALQGGRPGERGWGIPMATDIAFVVGFLALLGSRVPLGLKILLLSLAIVDDIGAVLVIALFYSTGVSLTWLAVAGLGFVLTGLLNRIGVRRVPVYVVVGGGIWLAFLQAGIHPTVAGVLLGLLTPASAWIGDRTLIEVLTDALRHGQQGSAALQHRSQLAWAAREAVSPLQRLETGLHPWVAFGIMPLFSLANAGVPIEIAALTHPVALAVTAGLVLGKPVGIFLFSWLAVQVGLARLPGGVNWKVLLGGGCLGGIGFTMSLFIAGLALQGQQLAAGKLGTLVGSAVSAVAGCLLLLTFLGKKTPAPAPEAEGGPNETWQEPLVTDH